MPEPLGQSRGNTEYWLDFLFSKLDDDPPRIRVSFSIWILWVLSCDGPRQDTDMILQDQSN